MPAPLVALLAHQGGWDEMLLVAGPVALLFLLLNLASKRAKRHLHDATVAAGGPDTGEPGSDPASGATPDAAGGPASDPAREPVTGD